MIDRLQPQNWAWSIQTDQGELVGKGQTDESVKEVALRWEIVELDNGYRLRAALYPERTIVINKVTLQQAFRPSTQDAIFCNGWQSWTESRHFYWNESIPQLRAIARPMMGYYGDYHIPWIKRGKGYLHSWSWTSLQRPDEPLLFLGSLNERNAFTCFSWQQREQVLVMEVDCREHTITEPFVVLDIVVLSGNTTICYDQWVDLMLLPKLRAPKAKGWTSWYQHYTNISEEVIMDNLQQFTDRGQVLDIFQIDDGFQTAVGDWLSLGGNFPNGLTTVAKRIRNAGSTPGLWLAPTVADKRSALLRKHPEWVSKDPKGKPIKAGYNPMWGGWYYALNTEHEAWQNDMQNVFETVIKDWGFGMLKLDFLFAACLYPSPTKTRAQLMHNVLQRLRQWAGNAYLLGCGTPLASGFGVFDYCRIGADIHLSWEHKMLRWFRHRERVSTIVALRTVVGRWPLAGRVWRNDPDVYLLRDENIKMSASEKGLVHRVNALLGELLFTSDNVGTYSAWQQQEEAEQDRWWQQTVTAIEPLGLDKYKISGKTEGEAWVLDLENKHLTLCK